MRTATDQLNAHLLNATSTFAFDCYTITLASGAVMQWTDADAPIRTTDGRLFTLGPAIKRDRVSWKRGLEVDELEVTLSASVPYLVTGVPLVALAVAGGLDSARVVLERVYLNSAQVVQGQMIWFIGTVADITDITRLDVPMKVKSDLQNLDVQMPINLYQAGCRNNLFDVRCTVNRAAFTAASTVSAIDPSSRTYFQSPYRRQPSGYFSLGVLTFTSGANAGFSRMVKDYQLGPDISAFSLARPFPFPFAVYDAFTVTAGCDKTQATCGGTFGNLIHLRAEPYIPAPEVAT